MIIKLLVQSIRKCTVKCATSETEIYFVEMDAHCLLQSRNFAWKIEQKLIFLKAYEDIARI